MAGRRATDGRAADSLQARYGRVSGGGAVAARGQGVKARPTMDGGTAGWKHVWDKLCLVQDCTD